MSMSPTISDGPSKRRRISGTDMDQHNQGEGSDRASQQTHIPKRGARACTACRKGKNRCEGEAPCKRCQFSGTLCVFEKPEKKNVQPMSNASVERLARLEGQYLVMQSQMIGMQSSLDRILSAVQTQSQPNGGVSQQGSYLPRNGFETGPEGYSRRLPTSPGFAPPGSKYGPYAVVSSSAGSSDDETDDTNRAPINAPIEALQDLANAAAEAAAVTSTLSPRTRKRRKAEIPRNVFPQVVEKRLVSEAEARELHHIFFAGCHIFLPLFDPAYNSFENLMEQSPLTFNAILTVAARIRCGNGPFTPTFFKCLEEAQNIARLSLLGPATRKEAVQGMLLLSAWSTSGWLSAGHAMRMALDLGLHRALDRLAEEASKPRTEDEDRDLIVSSRIWLCLFRFDHQLSLDTGRPIVLRDDSSIRHCRLLLTHPMASPTDVRLISQVELIIEKEQIYESFVSQIGQVNHTTLTLVRHGHNALEKWWTDCDELHRHTMDEDSLMRKILVSELHYARLWVVCLALRGVSWDKMPFEQKELAFQGKDAALNCLSIFLTSSAYRAALRYAVHESLANAAFSGLYLLKIACLFPGELDLGSIIGQVDQLAQLLIDVSAERYALTLRVMLATLRRKMSMVGAPMPHEGMGGPPGFVDASGVPHLQIPFTVEEIGYTWPSDRGMFNPSVVPPWLQEQNLADLGLPPNGTDGVFVHLTGANGWTADYAPIPEAW